MPLYVCPYEANILFIFCIYANIIVKNNQGLDTENIEN